MAVITTGSFAKTLWPGVNKWFGMSYDEFEVEYTKLFDTYTSSRAFEEDVGTSMFGLPAVKNEGAPISYDTGRQGFTTRYNWVVYALGFIVTREAYEDDLYDIVGKQKAQALAFSMRQNKEIVCANVYNRAFNTSYTGGDGSTLIASAGGGGSSSHPNIAGGTYTNGPSVAVDLSEAALEQMVIDLAGYTNDRGLKIKVLPKTLIIPPNLQFEASRILTPAQRPFTANNENNALKTLGWVPEVVVNHYLTDTDAWFIRTNVKDGLKYWSRRAMSFGMDEDFDTENAKYKALERFGVGWTDPRALYGSPGV